MHQQFRATLFATVTSVLTLLSWAASAEPIGVVSHIKVLSDKVEDFSSLEAWKKSCIKEGMTDREKAMAVWASVVKFQHQDSPPSEFLQVGDNVLDPIKMANVYGYSYCSVASANVLALARYAGLQARGWTIHGHVVPEIFWDGQWHLLDASLVTYFPNSRGELAGVEEIVGGVKEWLNQHPELKGDDVRLRKFMATGGWRNGPPVLSRCSFYDDNGWLPAATHGWYSTMQEYDGRTLFPFEAGYSLGYEVNIQLRRGEKITRNWSNRGLHVNMRDADAPGCLKANIDSQLLRYAARFGDLAPGRIGNGLHEYEIPLADGGFRSGALVAENLASHSEDAIGPKLHVKDSRAPATLIVRFPSSFIYLTGAVDLRSEIPNGGRIVASVSDNNGLNWKSVTNLTASGEHRIDLTPFVFRRYDYRLKLTLHGPGTGLNALKISHDFQHSQRPLPALTQGRNEITFSAGPEEGTITIEGSTDVGNREKQLVFIDFHPEATGLQTDKFLLAGGTGQITFPLTTPGEMTRLRLGTFYRARDPRDGWDVQVSFDRGQSFQSAARLSGPAVSAGNYTVVTNIPPGTKASLIRYVGTQRNTTMISNFRVSADYREPHGGFRPIEVTYRWEEEGIPKSDRHVLTKPIETFTISCKTKPVMTSIALNWAE